MTHPKWKSLSCLLLLALSFSGKGQILGAELNYTFLDSNTLTIHASIYHTCSTKALNDTLTISPLNKGLENQRIQLTPDSSFIDSSAKSQCSINCTKGYMVSHFNYVSVIDYWNSIFADSLLISIKPGYRLKSANLISKPTASPMVIQASIYGLYHINSSFIYSLNPKFQGISDQAFMSSPGLYDQDLLNKNRRVEDSSYHAPAQLLSSSGKVSYINNYSKAQPLKTKGNFYLDPNSGDLRFEPIGTGITYQKTRTSEYRNGVLIGFTEREQVIEILNSTDLTHVISGKGNSQINNPENYLVNTCDLDSNQLIFIGTDGKKNDFDSILVFNPANISNQTSHFVDSAVINLKFDSTLINGQFSKLFVSVYTNPCQPWTFASATFLIRHNYSPRPKLNNSYLGNREIALVVRDTGSSNKQVNNWMFNGSNLKGDSVTSFVKLPGQYRFILTSATQNGRCITQIDSHFTTPIFPYVVGEPGNAQICKGTQILLSATVHNIAQIPSIIWSTGKTGSTELLDFTQDTSIIVSISYPDGFENHDTLHFKAKAPPFVKIKSLKAHCQGNEITLKADSAMFSADSFISFRWKNISDSILGIFDSLKLEGSQKILLEAENYEGCQGADTVDVHYTKFTNFPSNKNSICLNDTCFLEIQSDSQSNIIWSFHPKDTFAKGSTFNTIGKQDTMVFMSVYYDDGTANCHWSDSTRIKVWQPPVFKRVDTMPVCKNDSPLVLNDSNFIQPIHGTWTETLLSENTLLSDSIFSPAFAKEELVEFIYTITDTNSNCKNQTSFFINILPIPDIDFIKEIQPCDTSDIINLREITLNSAFWYGKGVFYGNDSTPYYRPVGKEGTTDTLFVSIQGENCSATESQIVEVSLHATIHSLIKSGKEGIIVRFTDNTNCQVDYRKWTFWDLPDKTDTAKNVSRRFANAGVFEVTLEVYDTVRGISDSAEILITVVPVGLESVEEFISIYPNPTSNLLNIQSNQLIETLQLFNSSGKLVTYLENVESQSTTLNTSTLPQGLYILIVNGKEFSSRQLIEVIK